MGAEPEGPNRGQIALLNGNRESLRQMVGWAWTSSNLTVPLAKLLSKMLLDSLSRAVASKLRRGVTFVQKWTMIRVRVCDACAMSKFFLQNTDEPSSYTCVYTMINFYTNYFQRYIHVYSKPG